MTNARYSMGAIILHWLIAVAVIVNWRIAEAAEEAASREEGFAIMAQHKALGITILVLTLLRLGWRLSHREPPFLSTVTGFQAKLAKAVHAIFYILLIGLPLGGWAASSFYGYGVDLYGLFSLPALPVGVNPDVGHEIGEIHGTLGTAMLLLIVLHAAGALKHHFIDKDGTLYRILPFGTPKAD